MRCAGVRAGVASGVLVRRFGEVADLITTPTANRALFEPNYRDGALFLCLELPSRLCYI